MIESAYNKQIITELTFMYLSLRWSHLANYLPLVHHHHQNTRQRLKLPQRFTKLCIDSQEKIHPCDEFDERVINTFTMVSIMADVSVYYLAFISST